MKKKNIDVDGAAGQYFYSLIALKAYLDHGFGSSF